MSLRAHLFSLIKIPSKGNDSQIVKKSDHYFNTDSLALVLRSRREPGCFMDHDSQEGRPGNSLNVTEAKSWEL